MSSFTVLEAACCDVGEMMLAINVSRKSGTMMTRQFVLQTFRKKSLKSVLQSMIDNILYSVEKYILFTLSNEF